MSSPRDRLISEFGGSGFDPERRNAEQELLADAVRVESKGPIPGILKPFAAGLDFTGGLVKGAIGTPRGLLELLDLASTSAAEFVTGRKAPSRTAAGRLAEMLPSAEGVGEALGIEANFPTAERIGEFLGGAAIFPGGTKFATSAPGILSSVLGGAADVALEEAGADPLLRILGTGAATLAGGGLGGVAQAVRRGGQLAAEEGGVLRGLNRATKEKTGEFAGRALLKPAQVQEAVVQDLKQLRLPFTIGEVTEGGVGPSVTKFIEGRLNKSIFGESSFARQSANLKKATLDQWESVLRRQNLQSRIDAELANSTFQELVENNLQNWKAQDRELYAYADSLLQPGEKINARRLISDQRNFLKRLEKSFTPTPNEKSLITDMKRNIEGLEKAASKTGGKFEVPVDRLLATKRSLNRLSDFEYGSSLRKEYNKLARTANELIESHKAVNPQFVEAFRAADASVAARKGALENHAIVGLMKAQTPNSLVAKMGSAQGMQQVRAALPRNAAGDQIYNSLKRIKVDQLLGDELIKAVENGRLGAIHRRLSKPEMRSQLKRLLGKKDFARVELLGKNLDRLAKQSMRFANPSGTADQLLNSAKISGLVGTVAGAVTTGNPVAIMSAISGLSYAGAAHLTSRMLTDPIFVEAALAAAKAKNPASYQNALLRAGQRISIALRELDEVEQNRDSLRGMDVSDEVVNAGLAGASLPVQ